MRKRARFNTQLRAQGAAFTLKRGIGVVKRQHAFLTEKGAVCFVSIGICFFVKFHA